ncbi:MAG: hypothetical protein H7A23_13615 [Leptospiraceae bacterium]|nr:hypothetical protein [Leptospiraceae bacterium]MCP5495588.1 hypothetical protein [Leptospiraceae bacterium]
MEKKQDGQGQNFSSNSKFIFLIFLASAFILVGYFLGLPHYYLGWFSFLIAAFSVAGNDAIQTIGTFIESKRRVHWLPKVIVFCGLLMVVIVWSWYKNDGQIHFGRLSPNKNNVGFPYPEQFNLIQLLAPIVLVIITRLKAPISTTFLVLSLFGSKNIDKMLLKSFIGYGVAFCTGLLIWFLLALWKPDEYKREQNQTNSENEKIWSFLQWISTSALWISWLYQDTANIAVYIPRSLNILELFLSIALIALALAIIIKNNGGKIQEIVSDKSDINNAKAATIIDFVYALILFFFGTISKMPMSTTWVFLGLLAGREVILHVVTKRDEPYLVTLRKVGKDVLLASLGISISIAIFILSMILYPKPDSPFQELFNLKSSFYLDR